MKRSILFVDDELNLLSGLRRMLRHMRGEWDMTFANGPAEALALIPDNQFDVVVSDMRMPEMDGASLLKKVRQISPGSVRIILSGYSEEEAVLRTVGPAHQYLAKPCEADLLVETVRRALALREYIGAHPLSQDIAGLENLPSPPSSFARLISAMDDPLSSLDDITAILAGDVAMSAQTLKLTNSAYFSLSENVSSLKKAVSLLGIDTIRALILVSSFFKEFSGPPEMARRIETLSNRSMSIGRTAQAIAEHERLPKPVADQAHCAGMLCHVGTLAMMANWPEKFSEILQLVEQEGLGILEAESRIFGADHTRIGAYLLGLWGFPDPIAEAVAYHHLPSNFDGQDIPPALICVHAAQELVKGGTAEEVEANLDTAFLERCGVGAAIAQWQDRTAAD